MRLKGFHHVYHEQAGEGVGTGGGTPAAAPSTPGTGAASAGAAGSGDAAGQPGGAASAAGGNPAAQGGAEANLLAAGAALSGGGLADKLPEQLRVMKDDGTLDTEASAAKLADSYAALTARMRETGAPPKEAKEYTVTVPEALAGKWAPEGDAGYEAFRGKAHELGLTQKQFDGVMGAYLERIPGLVEHTVTKAHESALSELGKHWTTAEAMQAGQRNAYKAVSTVMGDETDSLVEQLGNNPLFLRFAAQVGAQMREDIGVPTSGAAGSAYAGKSREQLMSEPAYTQATHPDHKTVSALVRKMFEREFGTEAAA